MKRYHMDKSDSRCNIATRRQYIKSHTAAEIEMPKQNIQDHSSEGSNKKVRQYITVPGPINKLVQHIQDI